MPRPRRLRRDTPATVQAPSPSMAELDREARSRVLTPALGVPTHITTERAKRETAPLICGWCKAPPRPHTPCKREDTRGRCECRCTVPIEVDGEIDFLSCLDDD